MTLYAYTDGASRGNPGESGIGIILKNDSGSIVYAAGGYIGRATNNIAEYQALIACLTKAMETDCRKLIVYSDSELMVRQLHGRYRVKDKILQQHFRKVKELLKDASFEFSIVHIARELNAAADELANAGIEAKQPLQV